MNCEPVNYESIHVTHDKDYQTKRNEQMVRRIRQGLRQFYKVCKFAKGQTGVLMLDDWWSLSLRLTEISDKTNRWTSSEEPRLTVTLQTEGYGG